MGYGGNGTVTILIRGKIVKLNARVDSLFFVIVLLPETQFVVLWIQFFHSNLISSIKNFK